MRPIAMMNAAAAPTDKPAICAGFIDGAEVELAAAAVAVGSDVVVEANEVTDGVEDIASATAVWAVVERVDDKERRVDVGRAWASDVDDAMTRELVELLVVTVRTVWVCCTASVCRRQTLYAAVA
jgi:hypothetical protein